MSTFLALLLIADVQPAPIETEAAVRTFAKSHHPELDDLLRTLQKQPNAYRAAIASLDRDRLRLARTKERNPSRYEADLAKWKLDSRIRLAAARMANTPDDEGARGVLRDLVAERSKLRLEAIDEEQRRLEQRLKALEAEQSKLVGDFDGTVDGQVERLVRAAATARKRAARSAAKRRPAKNGPKKTQSKSGSPKATPAPNKESN